MEKLIEVASWSEMCRENQRAVAAVEVAAVELLETEVRRDRPADIEDELFEFDVEADASPAVGFPFESCVDENPNGNELPSPLFAFMVITTDASAGERNPGLGNGFVEFLRVRFGGGGKWMCIGEEGPHLPAAEDDDPGALWPSASSNPAASQLRSLTWLRSLRVSDKDDGIGGCSVAAALDRALPPVPCRSRVRSAGFSYTGRASLTGEFALSGSDSDECA